MKTYCHSFRLETVQQAIAESGSKRIPDIAKELGVSRSSMYRWLKNAGPQAAGVVRKVSQPQFWGMASRLKVLLETRDLDSIELGKYLRHHGLYHDQIERWKREVLLEVKKAGRNHNEDENAALLRRIRELEHELKRKDHALREATALIALQKKAELVFGVNEDERPAEKTESESHSSSKKQDKKARE